MIREYGDQANLEAAQKADALLERGDLQAQSEWARVVEAVESIQSQMKLKDLGAPVGLHPSATMHTTEATDERARRGCVRGILDIPEG